MEQTVGCVHLSNNYRPYKLDRKKITGLATEICRRLGVAHYEVCIQFLSPKSMKALNVQYRNKDKSTDVLSFPQYEWKKPLKVKLNPPANRPILNPLPLGDVLISADDAHANAKDSKHGLDQEVCFLLIHGILHLVGHDHMKPAEKKRMFAEQTKLMKIFRGKRSEKPFWEKCIKKVKPSTKPKLNLKLKSKSQAKTAPKRSPAKKSQV